MPKSNKTKNRFSNEYLVSNCQQLQAIQHDLNGNYTLTQAINCTETRKWNNGYGFIPIGTQQNPFTGIIDGKGFYIDRFFINQTGYKTAQAYAGLFGLTYQAQIIDLHFSNTEIHATANFTGTLIAYANATTVYSSSAQGTVASNPKMEATSIVGGLIGLQSGSTEESCFKGNTTNGHIMGGLVGENIGYIKESHTSGFVYSSYDASGYTYGGLIGKNLGSISNSSSSSEITMLSGGGGYKAGGLVAINLGHITNTYATGHVTSSTSGGLIAINSGYVSLSYATGNVKSGTGEGGPIAGGLVGVNSGEITNSYAAGSAIAGGGGGGPTAGGLVGINTKLITRSFATGYVFSGGGGGGPQAGGLVGTNKYDNQYGEVTISFYNSETSGQHDTGKGTPKTTAQMKQRSTYTDWDFYNVWQIKNGVSYPFIRQTPFSISFQPITSPQHIQTPFQVNLSTNNEPFHGTIIFDSERGPIIPTSITMTGDSWVGNITLYSAGKENKLALRWQSADGNYEGISSSNIFDVLTAKNQIPNNSAVTGRIVDENGSPIAKAKIDLYLDNPKYNVVKAERSTVTDSQGNYNFVQLPAETVHLSVSHPNFAPEELSTPTEAGLEVTINGELHSSCPVSTSDAQKPPVLFVAGVMGSKTHGIIYPRLSFLPPAWDDKNLVLHNPKSKLVAGGGVAGWDRLKKLFQKNGYQSNCNLFDVPYDWTLPIETIVQRYLIPQIDRAKKEAQSSQVDIISHSMGGLVVRAYIQSPLYTMRNDIRRFAMAGTPNQGSDRVYFIWEGGDPIAADKSAPINFWGRYFYTNTLDYLYRDRYLSQFGYNTLKKQLCTFPPLDPWSPSSCNEDTVYQFTHTQVKAAGQLLSTYDNALLDKQKSPVYITAEENTLLRALNNLPCRSKNGCTDHTGEFYNFIPPENILTNGAPTHGQVQTRLFAGIDQKTLDSIYVSKTQTSLYKDGKPTGSYIFADGDGTALLTSVTLTGIVPKDKQLICETRKGEHSELIRIFRDDLLKFIINPKPTLELDEAESPQEQAGLAIQSHGHTQPHIKEINNRQLNITNDYRGEYSAVLVEEIPNGTYRVALQSVGNEDYEIEIMYFPNNSTQFIGTKVVGYADNTLTEFKISVNDANSKAPISFSRAFDHPTSLQLASTSQPRLSWQDASNSTYHDVAYYQIFSKNDAQPFFTLLAKSVQTNYLIKLPWTEAKQFTYIVRAMLNTGNSTFFSQPAWVNATTLSEEKPHPKNQSMQKNKTGKAKQKSILTNSSCHIAPPYFADVPATSGAERLMPYYHFNLALPNGWAQKTGYSSQPESIKIAENIVLGLFLFYLLSKLFNWLLGDVSPIPADNSKQQTKASSSQFFKPQHHPTKHTSPQEHIRKPLYQNNP